MSRRKNTSLAGSPVLVGAVTVLVTIVAVVLAYNANNGLPFAPSLEIRVQATSAAALTKGSEVREGGLRIGFVSTIRTVRLPDGTAGAEMAVRMDETDLPVDTAFTIRPRSPLGLKYLEMVRGSSERIVEDGHTFPTRQTLVPVQLDDFTRMFDGRTRVGVRENIQGFGNALAGRGAAVNQTLSELPRLFRHAAPVARNLADPRTRLGRFFRELGDTARVLAPEAATQADLFTRTALTFEAISLDVEKLKQTISASHPAFQAGIESFPVQRPFLTDSAALAREMQPVARELRPALPIINDALETGIPVTERSVDFYGDLRPTLVSLRELMEDPGTGRALRGLTANVTSLQPQLRFLGPYQTVCNYWNYFFTFLGEHVSQRGPYGYGQRAAIKSAGQQSNSPASMGASEPANAEDYREPSRPRGAPYRLHGQAYSRAISPRGEADCENGQRGYMRRLARFSDPRFQIVTDPEIPGNQGPTYKGRRRVPRGQTFADRPLTGAQLDR